MKTLLLNYTNSKYKKISDLSKPNFIEFCSNNNFQYHLELLTSENPNECRLKKCELISNFLKNENFEYLIYSDVDILITNSKFDFWKSYEFSKDITFCKDELGLCSGFIVIKNTEFSKLFFETCVFLKSHREQNCETTESLKFWNGRYDKSSEADQELIKSLYYSYPHIRKNIDVNLPESIISNPESSMEDVKNSFAYHYWSRDIGIDYTVETMNYYLNFI
jgi:hypothetical protein